MYGFFSELFTPRDIQQDVDNKLPIEMTSNWAQFPEIIMDLETFKSEINAMILLVDKDQITFLRTMQINN